MQLDEQNSTTSGAQMVLQSFEQQVMDAVERLAHMSHVLRTPLTAIKGYAETLLRHEQQLSEHERQEFLQTIHHASHELAKTIDVLLEGSSAHRQKKHYQQDMQAWRKQQGEIEQRLGLLRERQQAVQADIEAICAAQPSLAWQKQELAQQQYECAAKAWAHVYVRNPPRW